MRLVRINVKVELNCVLKEVTGEALSWSRGCPDKEEDDARRFERGMGLRSAVVVSLIAPTNWMNEHGEAMGLRYKALQ